MDHVHNYFCSVFGKLVAGDYNFNAVAFKFETCTQFHAQSNLVVKVFPSPSYCVDVSGGYLLNIL